MNLSIPSVSVGILLAILDFFISTYYSSRVTMASKVISVLLTLIGFITRLGILGLIFYALAHVKSIHFQMTLFSFALCFTLCLFIKTIIVYQKWKSIKPKRSGE